MLEDDLSLCSVVSDFMGLHGHEMDCCGEVVVFRKWLLARTYDLILLDLNLSDTDGLDVLEEVRAIRQTLLYVVSGRSDAASRLRAYELGADDFIVKPFSVKELELKVRNAMLRGQQAAADVVEGGGCMPSGRAWRLDARARAVVGFPEDARVALTRGEYELFRVLLEAGGSVVAREKLLSHLGSAGQITSAESITTLIYRLRRKFAQLGAKCPICTVAGEGYRIVP